MSFKFSPVPRFKIIGFPMKSICCVPSLGSRNEVRRTLSSLPPIVPLFISHRVKIIAEPFRERFPASGPPISPAMLAPRALPLFLQGPQFDLWENSWQIGMSILMDDIICTILLIMYDYLSVCLFSLVAIDPRPQQLKRGGVAIDSSWKGHQAERSPAFVSWKATSEVQVIQRALVDVIFGGPRKGLTQARLTMFLLLEDRERELRESNCLVRHHTVSQYHGFSLDSLTLKQVFLPSCVVSWCTPLLVAVSRLQHTSVHSTTDSISIRTELFVSLALPQFLQFPPAPCSTAQALSLDTKKPLSHRTWRWFSISQTPPTELLLLFSQQESYTSVKWVSASNVLET